MKYEAFEVNGKHTHTSSSIVNVYFLRYTHLNAEFQRIARRDKKTFLSDQCKEIEENNRMGKSRDLFKTIRDNKGTFHAKMGSIKDRNGREPPPRTVSHWKLGVLPTPPSVP